MQEETITIDAEAAVMIRQWADAYVKQYGLAADCTKIEAVINQLVAAFDNKKPKLRVAAGSAKEQANG